LTKIQQNWTKPWNFDKAKQLVFTGGLKQVVRFLADDEQMVLIGDEHGYDSVSTYSQSECLPKGRQNRLLGCFSAQFLNNLKLIIDILFRYHLTVL
jgi:hypothetical protein